MDRNVQGAGSGIAWVLAIVVGIGLLSQCESDTKIGPTNHYDQSNDVSAVMNATDSDEIAPPPPANKAAAMRAARHLRLALDAEGFAGAMIYSQNCFASVRRSFSWDKLDQCGAFDALAVLGAGESLIFGAEKSYFDDAAANQRFLAAAVVAGTTQLAQEEHLAVVKVAALERVTDLRRPTVGPSQSQFDASPTRNEAPPQSPASLPDLAAIAAEDASTIRITCALDRGDGPAVYNTCLRKHLAVVVAGSSYPDFSAVADEDASTIRIACSVQRGDGPGAYNACLKRHLRTVLAGAKYPDLSMIDREDASTIRIACSIKRGEGPAAYNECLRRHLRDVTQ